jgi:dUTP pyrophosphatase
MLNLEFKRLSEHARLPVYGSDGAAGMDLFSANEETIVLAPHERKAIPIGWAISYNDPRFYMRIAPRSGLALKGIDVGAGVIDYDYRGEIKVLLINGGTTDFVVERHMKIAQMIPTQTARAQMVEVDELADTIRGEGGFGSTGLF